MNGWLQMVSYALAVVLPLLFITIQDRMFCFLCLLMWLDGLFLKPTHDQLLQRSKVVQNHYIKTWSVTKDWIVSLESGRSIDGQVLNPVNRVLEFCTWIWDSFCLRHTVKKGCTHRRIMMQAETNAYANKEPVATTLTNDSILNNIPIIPGARKSINRCQRT